MCGAFFHAPNTALPLSLSLRGAVLGLFQQGAVCSSAHGELREASRARALTFGAVGVVTVLGAGRPIGPLADLTVLGDDTRLVRDWQRLLMTQARVANQSTPTHTDRRAVSSQSERTNTHRRAVSSQSHHSNTEANL